MPVRKARTAKGTRWRIGRGAAHYHTRRAARRAQKALHVRGSR